MFTNLIQKIFLLNNKTTIKAKQHIKTLFQNQVAKYRCGASEKWYKNPEAAEEDRKDGYKYK